MVGEAEDVWKNRRRSAKWRLARCRGSGRKNESKPVPTEKGGDQDEEGKASGRADLKGKAKTKT